MQSESSANGPKGRTIWDLVDWREAGESVTSLRQRIFKAARANDLGKVRSLQKLMLRNHSNILMSVRRVTQVNAGKNTPGVDKVLVKTPAARGKLVDLLATLQPWRASPVRRVYIPKKTDSNKRRPLGIPTVLDRCLQAMVKNALEPEWEARFEGSSYGFRPGRSPKTMMASTQVAYYARNAGRWGVRAGAVSVDLPRVVARKDRVVGQSRSGLNRKVEERKTLHLYFGHARFMSQREVRVGEEVLESERIFIDTGTSPDVPPLEGLRGIDFLDNASIMRLNEVPEHLLVLGGGYVGMEFGQMFRRFGSRVTVVQREQQILPHEDADVAEALQQALEAEGLRFLLGGTTTRVENEQGGVALSVVVEGTTETVHGSHLLVATGRRPNTDDLGLQDAGVQTDERGFIRVNNRLETSVPGVWALGDVKGASVSASRSLSAAESRKQQEAVATMSERRGHHISKTGAIRNAVARLGMQSSPKQPVGAPDTWQVFAECANRLIPFHRESAEYIFQPSTHEFWIVWVQKKREDMLVAVPVSMRQKQFSRQGFHPISFGIPQELCILKAC